MSKPTTIDWPSKVVRAENYDSIIGKSPILQQDNHNLLQLRTATGPHDFLVPGIVDNKISEELSTDTKAECPFISAHFQAFADGCVCITQHRGLSQRSLYLGNCIIHFRNKVIKVP